MRKFLFFCFLIFVALNSSAQYFDVSSHTYADNPTHVVSIHSKCYYTDDGSMTLVGVTAPSLPSNTFHTQLKNLYKRLRETSMP